ncbi:MAG: hypothetical protein HQK83_18915 [Fibrobacteria bacterium]|nr:hypothetical protein [Fibrobacteria bacterium]
MYLLIGCLKNEKKPKLSHSGLSGTEDSKQYCFVSLNEAARLRPIKTIEDEFHYFINSNQWKINLYQTSDSGQAGMTGYKLVNDDTSIYWNTYNDKYNSLTMAIGSLK